MASTLTRFAKSLGLRLPLVQAPMAGVSTPQLAAEVSKCGGLGSLGLGASDVDTARAAIRSARQLGATLLNANFFCHAPPKTNEQQEAVWLSALAPLFVQFGAQPPRTLQEPYSSFIADDQMQQMVVEEAPEVVSFHFGLPPADVTHALKMTGCTLFATATSESEASACARAGMDAVIVQGIEAGGHRGRFVYDEDDRALPMLELMESLKQNTGVQVPLIAAGGMMDGKDCVTALNAGADLVQLGTAFVLCAESASDDGYRAALMQSEKATDTVLTSVFSGRPARALRNAMVEFGESKPRESVPEYPLVFEASKALHAAGKEHGDHSCGAHWAGMGAPRARNLRAAELMQVL
eukprot:CAMPEP_0185852042 /NCGR_PEP_ID=MMETSP1354-20130828/12939_1 /TAXON_ID=708628 /ORGANISM="Erythrolobus madagascarensis, Strain CCMP3276" /LENGTH=351 /DNA_ID=CAMNT_0028553189 /DNA_START=76 /DNA_END=1127 /DNA_ORIENTATION=+